MVLGVQKRVSHVGKLVSIWISQGEWDWMRQREGERKLPFPAQVES
jgi:hypothetical protein